MTENLIPLDLYIKQNVVTIGEVLKLGLDMCDAISTCHSSGVLHPDIKESNIFVDESGHYKLGNSNAGKVADIQESCSGSKDICSLGIVLYKLLNDQRIPFLPDAPAPFTEEDKKAAKERHLNGERIPLPANAKKKLGDIVVKACSTMKEGDFLSGEACPFHRGPFHRDRDDGMPMGYIDVEELRNDLLKFQNAIAGTGYDQTVVPQVSGGEKIEIYKQ